MVITRKFSISYGAHVTFLRNSAVTDLPMKHSKPHKAASPQSPMELYRSLIIGVPALLMYNEDPHSTLKTLSSSKSNRFLL